MVDMNLSLTPTPQTPDYLLWGFIAALAVFLLSRIIFYIHWCSNGATDNRRSKKVLYVSILIDVMTIIIGGVAYLALKAIL